MRGDLPWLFAEPLSFSNTEAGDCDSDGECRRDGRGMLARRQFGREASRPGPSQKSRADGNLPHADRSFEDDA